MFSVYSSKDKTQVLCPYRSLFPVSVSKVTGTPTVSDDNQLSARS